MAPESAPLESESAPASESSAAASEIIGYNPKFHAADWIPRYYQTDKRSPSSPLNSLDSMPQFLQSLNGAERLRFG